MLCIGLFDSKKCDTESPKYFNAHFSPQKGELGPISGLVLRIFLILSEF